MPLSLSVNAGVINVLSDLCLTEEPIKFTKPLADQEVPEKEEITLTCEVSKLGKKPKWFLDDEEIKAGDRTVLTSRGLVHKLVIEKAKLHDEGKYTVAFGDVKCSANVTVKGMVYLCIYMHI